MDQSEDSRISSHSTSKMEHFLNDSNSSSSYFITPAKGHATFHSTPKTTSTMKRNKIHYENLDPQLPAWEIPTSPFDNLFRTGFGGLGQLELEDIIELVDDEEEQDNEEKRVNEEGISCSHFPSTPSLIIPISPISGMYEVEDIIQLVNTKQKIRNLAHDEHGEQEKESTKEEVDHLNDLMEQNLIISGYSIPENITNYDEDYSKERLSF